MIEAIRISEVAMGDEQKQPTESEIDTLKVARKSLTAAHDIMAGRALTADLIAIRRPGTGISPLHLNQIIGRQARRDLREGHIFSWEDLEVV